MQLYAGGIKLSFGNLHSEFASHLPFLSLHAAMKLVPGNIAERLEEMVLLTAQNLPQVEVANSYTILRELGSGAYGHVLMAVHQRQGVSGTE